MRPALCSKGLTKQGSQEGTNQSDGLNVSIEMESRAKAGRPNPKAKSRGKEWVIIGKETGSEKRSLGTSRGQARITAWSSTTFAVGFCYRSSNNINNH